MNIPFTYLNAVNEPYKKNQHVISRVIDSFWYLLGEEVRSFEQEYSEYLGVNYTIGVANGLDALRIILRAFMKLLHFSRQWVKS